MGETPWYDVGALGLGLPRDPANRPQHVHLAAISHTSTPFPLAHLRSAHSVIPAKYALWPKFHSGTWQRSDCMDEGGLACRGSGPTNDDSDVGDKKGQQASRQSHGDRS